MHALGAWKDGKEDWVSISESFGGDDWTLIGCGGIDGDKKDDLLVRQYSTGWLGYYSEGIQNNWNLLGRGVGMEWTVIA